MAIELCLFDLDNTLLRTDDLEQFRGRVNVGNLTPQYALQLKLAAFGLVQGQVKSRHIYTQEQMLALRARFPHMRWGVFTRSPRYYAITLLQGAYPDFQWDVMVGFEDVHRTKPYPDGVWLAMRQTGIDHPSKAVLVGDEKVDVVSAYRAGCWCFVDQTTWEPRKQEHWYALERVPDALFRGADELGELLASPFLRTPELEYLIAGERVDGRQQRIDKINHFFPRSVGGGYVPIHVMGRLFGEYDDIKYRRGWHQLTDQIVAYKNADLFPKAWVEAIHRFVRLDALMRKNVVVTVIPFKPNRKPRLEALLMQVAATYETPKFGGFLSQKIAFLTDVLAFRDGAVSSHGNHLNAEERFANVGENLYVKHPEMIQGKHVIVIDDVVTSGATLLWAHRYLIQAGAAQVSCMSLTQAIGAN